MGGKRIADQVRRALIAAAKVAPVVVAIDASGCSPTGCDAPEPPTGAAGLSAGFLSNGGTGGSVDAGPLIFGGRGGTDAGHDASKDGGQMRVGVLLVVVGVVGACGSTSDPWEGCPATPTHTTTGLHRVPTDNPAGLPSCPKDPGFGNRVGGYWSRESGACSCPPMEPYDQFSCVAYPRCISGQLADGSYEVSHYLTCMYWKQADVPPPCPL